MALHRIFLHRTCLCGRANTHAKNLYQLSRVVHRYRVGTVL